MAADRYDGAGNQISLAQSDGVYATPAGTFSYDGGNRLLAATVAHTSATSFVYDGEGRRVEKLSASGTTT
jgi:YD repeat-containing protein